MNTSGVGYWFFPLLLLSACETPTLSQKGEKNTAPEPNGRRDTTQLRTVQPNSDLDLELRSQILAEIAPLVSSDGSDVSKPPSVVVGVVHGAASGVIGAGSTIVGKSFTPDENSHYGLGSLTKVFTTFLLAHEISSQRLRSDSKVHLFLPQKLVPLFNKNITLEQLANHYSGLAMMPDNAPKQGGMANYSLSQLETCLKAGQCQPKQPNKYLYSNYGIGVLGIALQEQARVETFDELLRQKLLNKLGMSNTATKDDPYFSKFSPQGNNPQVVYGYTEGNLKQDFAGMGALASAGGLISTPKDMIKFLKMLLGLSHPEFASARSLMSARPQIGSPIAGSTTNIRQISYGIDIYNMKQFNGVGTCGSNLPDVKVFSKPGNTPSHVALLAWTPDKQIGVVIMANRAGFDKEIGCLSNRLLAKILNRAPVSTSNLTQVLRTGSTSANEDSMALNIAVSSDRSLNDALKIAATAVKSNPALTHINIELRDSVYTSPQTLKLDSKLGLNATKLTIRAPRGQEVRWTNSVRITKAQLKPFSPMKNVYQIALSQTPNTVFTSSHGLVQRATYRLPEPARLTNANYAQFFSKNLSLPAGSEDFELRATGHKDWNFYRCLLSGSHGPATGAYLYLDRDCFYASHTRFLQLSSQYSPFVFDQIHFLEGHPIFMDSPGEWVFNRRAKILYIYLEKPEDIFVHTGDFGPAITIDGIDNVTIENIQFDRWTTMNPRIFSSAQGGNFYGSRDGYAQIQTATIEVSNSKGTKVKNCTFTSIDGAGISIKSGAKNIEIESNTIKRIAGSGIIVGSFADSPYVSNPEGINIRFNNISYVGATYHSSAAMLLMILKDSFVELNTVTDTPYSGLSLGWGWRFDVQKGLGNVKVNNNYFARNMFVLNDGAAIYTLSAQPGTEITNNVIDQIYAAPSLIRLPIYLDSGSRFIRVENNIFRNFSFSNINPRFATLAKPIFGPRERQADSPCGYKACEIIENNNVFR